MSDVRPVVRGASGFRWARLEAIQRKREFIRAYRVARTALLAGTPIPFPHGTYWFRHFFGVAVAGAEENN